MNHRLLLAAMTAALLTPTVFAQEDPIEAQRQRNAALEAVSPVLDREEQYQPTPAEQIEAQFGSVRRNAVLINEILEDISKMGDQTEQATLLTQLNPDSLAVIRELIALEAKRVEAFGSAASSSGEGEQQVVQAEPQPVAAALPPSPKDQEVTIMMIREYTGQDKPTKVILRVGEGTPKAYYVGEEVNIAGRNYELTQVRGVGDNPKRKGYPLYRVELKQGSSKKVLEW